MKLDVATKTAIVARANRAPSVHNTQPARWAFDEGGVQIYGDESRFLGVGDPTLQDAGLSCGAALEGTLIALAEHGIKAVKVTDCWSAQTSLPPKGPYQGMRLAAKITLKAGATADPLSEFVKARFTWRGPFEKPTNTAALLKWGEGQENITLVSKAGSIAELAALNDVASLKFFNNRAYRDELLSFMRLSKKHPLWSQNGLNRESMHLSAFEGWAANIALRHPVFEIANRLGLGKALVSEADKTKTASAVAFFTVAQATSPIDMGRAFYRRWLEITQLGYAVWPMAVLADDKEINALCCKSYEIVPSRRLINVFRIGCVPKGTFIPPARFSEVDLILSAES